MARVVASTGYSGPEKNANPKILTVQTPTKIIDGHSVEGARRHVK
jgi:hypothetical protein